MGYGSASRVGGAPHGGGGGPPADRVRERPAALWAGGKRGPSGRNRLSGFSQDVALEGRTPMEMQGTATTRRGALGRGGRFAASMAAVGALAACGTAASQGAAGVK